MVLTILSTPFSICIMQLLPNHTLARAAAQPQRRNRAGPVELRGYSAA
jgi:hypothetical protein